MAKSYRPTLDQFRRHDECLAPRPHCPKELSIRPDRVRTDPIGGHVVTTVGLGGRTPQFLEHLISFLELQINRGPILRPLGAMQQPQERIFIASGIVKWVANTLIDFATFGEVIELCDLVELAGQLELAIEAIRRANGAGIDD